MAKITSQRLLTAGIAIRVKIRIDGPSPISLRSRLNYFITYRRYRTYTMVLSKLYVKTMTLGKCVCNTAVAASVKMIIRDNADKTQKTC